jgi:integrase
VGSANVGYGPSGRRRKVVYGQTQAEVRDKLRKLLVQLDSGVPLPDDRLTVGDVLERYLRDVVPGRVAASTADNYSTLARLHLIPALGRVKLSKLTPGDVQGFLRSNLEAGYSASTVRALRKLLVQAIGQAERWGLVARNVAALTDGPKLTTREGRSLTPDEARKLLDAVLGDRLEACYVLLLSLSLRRGEALGLSWADLDLERGIVRIRRALKKEGSSVVLGEVKTAGSRRAVNLPDQVVVLLRAHRARQAQELLALGAGRSDGDLVFTTPVGTPIDPDNFAKRFAAITQRAGLGRWHVHELRHSAGSIMLAAGVPLDVVSKVLGHASIRITADVYGHVMDPQRQHAADTMGAVLFGDREGAGAPG